MILFIKRILVAIMAALTALLSPIGLHPLGALAPKCDDVKLSFAVVSDIHLKGEYYRDDELSAALLDMQNATRRLDAFVMDGDNTDHGMPEQYEELKSVVEKFDPADNLFMVIGNHDTWSDDENGNNDPAYVKELFIKYSKEITDRDLDEVYFSQVINGYHFIVMGSESTHVAPTFSDRQIAWFASEMEAASQDGMPIFVFSHTPLNGTHGLPYSFSLDKDAPEDEGGIGEENDAVKEILTSYDNVFYITGHIHGGFTKNLRGILTDYKSVEDVDGVTCINLTCFGTPAPNGLDLLTMGTGYVVEVYGDRVELRARNFMTGNWLPVFDFTFDLG